MVGVVVYCILNLSFIICKETKVKLHLGNYFVSYRHVCTMFLSVEPKL